MHRCSISNEGILEPEIAFRAIRRQMLLQCTHDGRCQDVGGTLFVFLVRANDEKGNTVEIDARGDGVGLPGVWWFLVGLDNWGGFGGCRFLPTASAFATLSRYPPKGDAILPSSTYGFRGTPVEIPQRPCHGFQRAHANQPIGDIRLLLFRHCQASRLSREEQGQKGSGQAKDQSDDNPYHPRGVER